MMKAIILAAGYGTRLQKDLEKDTSGKYKHLNGVSKALLPVGNCALISHWIKALNTSASVHEVYVITNAVYYEAFQRWAQKFPNVRVLSDGTRTNEGRLGAVACLQLTVKHFAVDDDVIVIGGDTLFGEDFSLRAFTEHFAELQKTEPDSNLVLSYQCRDEETSKYGILEVDADLRVTRMKEKPQPTETHARNACPCFYLYSRATLPLLETFLRENEMRPIEEKDAPGTFLSWLILRRPVHIQRISGRFDVGNLPSYVECDRYFQEQLQHPELYLI
ncbi:glucose-1-phosphate thymidylyltransferase [Trichomycterus rosablanca]|uniref:glucose-1-phosphate thymidylyltransferase n=1 Tax=Trichomycterus rosablanca TaxID=2290929 RepID=UPI002F35C964